MTELPDWLPELILFDSHAGSWQKYIDFVYSKFYSDFIASMPEFEQMPVKITKQLIEGKERNFWHLVQEGPVEDQRTPDLRRCERIPWIRATIENSGNPMVKKWEKRIGRKTRKLLWIEEAEFLVVLEKRPSCWILWTAYCISWEHTKKRLRKEYEKSLKKPTPP
ncbi:MAG: hypothetical protein ACYTBV_05065 [Planctomycetota bacterium]|jgi:hypothetical protein